MQGENFCLLCMEKEVLVGLTTYSRTRVFLWLEDISKLDSSLSGGAMGEEYQH